MLGVPLAVMDAATGPYDDPKAWALPILVALTGVAWVIERRRRPGDPHAARRTSWWLAAVVAAYALWWVVSSLASIAPGQSLVGNFGRGLGLVTLSSAIMLFPLVRWWCRSAGAVRAVIDAALLGSAPVCLLALGQAMGWDPLPQAWDTGLLPLTVRSTFGQHIFLGSYLVLLIPLAVARLHRSIQERPANRSGEGPVPGRWPVLAGTAVWVGGAVGLVALASGWYLGGWLLVPWGMLGAVGAGLAVARPSAGPLLSAPLLAGILASQVLIVILSQARGAFLAMLAGMSVTGFALLAGRRAWKTLAAAAAGLVAVGVTFVLLNVPGSPLAPLARTELLRRLSTVTDLEHGSSGWFRLQVWRETLDAWRRQLTGEALFPGVSPGLRSLAGYGLETQLTTLDRLALVWGGALETEGAGWRAQYVVDRTHNVVLDHLVTGGLVAVGLWALVMGSILVIGAARAVAATGAGELPVRAGALGAIAAHLVEGQVGIATPMPLALFWVAAALATLPPWSQLRDRSAPGRRRPGWWSAALVAMALAAVTVAWLETRWLLASVAYASGVRSGLAGRSAQEAYLDFERARALVPWLPMAAEAAAFSALRLASAETDGIRRLALLRAADSGLARLRRGPAPNAATWMLSAQLAFAQVRAGDRTKIEASLDAFDRAARLRPWDRLLLTQWAWALLESRDHARARATAERAVTGWDDRASWLAWAVLARSARELGAGAAAEQAAERARGLAPAEERQLVESILSG